jgi:hypothetical protein
LARPEPEGRFSTETLSRFMRGIAVMFRFPVEQCTLIEKKREE